MVQHHLAVAICDVISLSSRTTHRIECGSVQETTVRRLLSLWMYTDDVALDEDGAGFVSLGACEFVRRPIFSARLHGARGSAMLIQGSRRIVAIVVSR